MCYLQNPFILNWFFDTLSLWVYAALIALQMEQIKRFTYESFHKTLAAYVYINCTCSTFSMDSKIGWFKGNIVVQFKMTPTRVAHSHLMTFHVNLKLLVNLEFPIPFSCINNSMSSSVVFQLCMRKCTEEFLWDRGICVWAHSENPCVINKFYHIHSKSPSIPRHRTHLFA